MALIGSLSSGVSAMQAFTKGIETIGNNIANVNTTAYKGERVNYSDNFCQVLSQASNTSTTPVVTSQVGTGSHVDIISGNFNQGNISDTGVCTDLAIDGRGYFEVSDPNTGELFATRAGNFTINDDGYILNSSGKYLQGLTGGEIAYDVSVDAAGSLLYTKTGVTTPAVLGDMMAAFDLSYGDEISVAAGQATAVNNAMTAAGYTDLATYLKANAPQLSSKSFDGEGNLVFTLTDGNSYSVGKVLLTSFTNENALVKLGDNLYTNFDAAGPLGGTMVMTAAQNSPGTNSLGSIKSEALELSNVDLTSEFANLITTQRSFQAASRIITVSDDILQEVVNLKR